MKDVRMITAMLYAATCGNSDERAHLEDSTTIIKRCVNDAKIIIQMTPLDRED